MWRSASRPSSWRPRHPRQRHRLMHGVERGRDRVQRGVQRMVCVGVPRSVALRARLTCQCATNIDHLSQHEACMADGRLGLQLLGMLPCVLLEGGHRRRTTADRVDRIRSVGSTSQPPRRQQGRGDLVERTNRRAKAGNRLAGTDSRFPRIACSTSVNAARASATRRRNTSCVRTGNSSQELASASAAPSRMASIRSPSMCPPLSPK